MAGASDSAGDVADIYSCFEDYLADKLRNFRLDESVFTSYITGILDSGDSSEEKIDSLKEILEGSVENLDAQSKAIFDRYESFTSSTTKNDTDGVDVKVDVDTRLAEIMGKQAQSIAVQKQYTEEQKQMREAILSQYGQVPIVEGDDAEGGSDTETKADFQKNDAFLVKNTNSETVAKLEKEKREKAKVDSQKKKERDREERERQKQQELDRKEKEKKRTQKGEKRR